jgi:hypothetical protein
MKLLYTNENRLLVNNVLNIIENEGIAIMLKNEYAGGAAGDIAPHETWLEVWVEDEDFAKAAHLLEAFNKDNQPKWECSRCGEFNDASFEFCWSCQQPASK